MHKSLPQLLVWLCLLTVINLMGQPQRRASIWHFGAGEGIDFSCGYPEKLTSVPVISFEGVTTLCDENGQLLFYSNGGGSKNVVGPGIYPGTIWNRNGEVMYDMGTESGGGMSSSQGVIAIPDPGQSQRYYLFTIDHYPSLNPLNGIHRGLRYFTIDMSRNNGLGEVVTSDIMVHRPAVECLTAVRHANGQDYWIITIDVDTKEWIVAPVTSQGVLPPLRYPRNLAHFPFIIKASPDGRYLSDGTVLYNFNANTGQPQQLAILTGVNTNCFSFSPGSRYYYAPNTLGPRKMMRYDMLSDDIPGTQTAIADMDPDFMGYMQMGPDGNLYFNTILFPNNIARLFTVRCPDSEAPAVAYTGYIFNTTASSNVFTGLNNLADFWFHEMSYALEADTFQRRLCPGIPLILETHCEGEQFSWSTGETTPNLLVTTPGEYRVSIVNSCFKTIETYRVVEGEAPTVAIDHAPVNEICDHLPLQLTAIATGADSLFWSTGETTAGITIQEGGRYEVTAANTCGVAVYAVEWPDELCCKIYLPNAFSPNLDGINDSFGPHHYTCDFGEYRLRVYSRWGEMVFTADKPEESWNGRLGNRDFGQGVYLWVLDYRLAKGGNGAWQRQSGVVHLLR